MILKTGQTIYEIVRSFNRKTNEPVYPANFIAKIFVNGIENTDIIINEMVSSVNDGLYSFSWSSNTLGIHQVQVENTTTEVVYVSEIYNVKPDNEVDNITQVYVGL